MGAGLFTDVIALRWQVGHPVRTLVVTQLRSGRLAERTLAHRGYFGGGARADSGT